MAGRNSSGRNSFESVSPPPCAEACVCSGSGWGICRDCSAALTPVVPRCRRCGGEARPFVGVASGCVECRRLPAGATARSLLRFDDTSRRLVVALKRGGPPTARWLGVVLASLILEPVDSVCWIPGGHDSRQRGFDHARRLAAGVAYGLSAPLRGLVTRQTEGVRQSTLSALARAENAADKFHVAGPVPHSVVLVDDVWTTGSTVSVVSRQLLDRGAQRVTVLTLARTLRESRGALR